MNKPATPEEDLVTDWEAPVDLKRRGQSAGVFRN
jgi:hypothetical protein